MPFKLLASLPLAVALVLGNVQASRAQEPSMDGGGILAPDEPAPVVRKAKRRRPPSGATGGGEAISALAGRYAVLREKRDTGCMLTLDNARLKGGARAQLAPGCRDQGIVIFDPTQWVLAQGELVLTARAGHKTHFLKDGGDAWKKAPKDGGKPLSLKRL